MLYGMRKASCSRFEIRGSKAKTYKREGSTIGPSLFFGGKTWGRFVRKHKSQSTKYKVQSTNKHKSVILSEAKNLSFHVTPTAQQDSSPSAQNDVARLFVAVTLRGFFVAVTLRSFSWQCRRASLLWSCLTLVHSSMITIIYLCMFMYFYTITALPLLQKVFRFIVATCG